VAGVSAALVIEQTFASRRQSPRPDSLPAGHLACGLYEWQRRDVLIWVNASGVTPPKMVAIDWTQGRVEEVFAPSKRVRPDSAPPL